jgi:argonaute-like protein implicated in RNA metabolism and viral defense
VGVQIADAWDQLKLFRPGNYPTIRGTAMLIDNRSGFLWTSGYVPRLDTYLGPDTPNPLYVSVRRGNAKIETVMADVLSLTKINFNTCLFNDRKPVTIRFADAIGDILVSAPVSAEQRLPFKFYI